MKYYLSGRAFIGGIAIRRADIISVSAAVNGEIKNSVRTVGSLNKNRTSKMMYGFLSTLDFLKFFFFSNLDYCRLRYKRAALPVLFGKIAILIASATGLDYLYLLLNRILSSFIPIEYPCFASAASLAVITALVYAAVRFLPVFKNLSGFHAAEHRIIACAEAGDTLTAERSKAYPMLHKRCGSMMAGFALFMCFSAMLFIPSDTNESLFSAVIVLVLAFSFIVSRKNNARNRHSIIAAVIKFTGEAAQKTLLREPDSIMQVCAVNAAIGAIDAEKNNSV